MLMCAEHAKAKMASNVFQELKISDSHETDEAYAKV